MSTTMSKMVVAVAVIGLGGAMSALRGPGTEVSAPSPAALQHAATGSQMCAIAASFSANPAMASEIRRAAGCGQASTAH